MENSNTCKTRDVVINFKDLCLAVFLHWRSIIACMLIFGILLCGFKYVKDLTSAAPATKKENIEEMAETLTPEQRADAN
ncbi:MAG: hypothetical protein KBS52_02100, partial [Clostridiales bacterium]|nr:hypothetical protein [Candidatus Equinaster intestinalis]